MAVKLNRKQRRGRVGLSYQQEQLQKCRLRNVAPSEPWVEAQFRHIQDQDPEGNEITYRFFDGKIFPPGGAKTAMVKCPRCGRIVPPNSIEHGECMDHQPFNIHQGYGGSPSAHAIIEIQHRNLRLEAVKLEPESKAALREEIKRFNQKQRKSRR